MRVVQVTDFGGPEVLVTTTEPDPVATMGQVVVNVSVVPILFVETQIRRGWGSDWFPSQPPYVPGFGIAGMVSSVGEGVDHGWIGSHVVADTGGEGGYAERALVPAERLIGVPDRLGLSKAAALLHDGRTALTLADEARIRRGDWVLILGVGGGLGILLVQLAHAAGARIIGAARGKRKLVLARELGANVVVDYTEPGWTDRIREATGGTGPHIVFDGVGGEIGRAALEITARNGWFSAHGAPSGSFADIDPQIAERRGITLHGVEQVQLAPAIAKQVTARALVEAVAGRLRPIIGQTFPLERAADAHAAIEGRNVIGKTVLLI